MYEINRTRIALRTANFFGSRDRLPERSGILT